MSRYKKHIFICTNERPVGHPKGCCKEKGSEEILNTLKKELAVNGLKDEVRANKSGCFDACEFGVSIVVYPDAIWYGGVMIDDVKEIIKQHIIDGIPVERLRIKDKRYLPDLFPTV